MSFYEHPILLFLLILVHSGTYDCSVVKRDSNGGINGSYIRDSDLEKSLFGGIQEKNLEQEILQELNHLSSRKQREIFNDLEKQHEKFNVFNKSLVLSEPENLSPLNVEELKSIRKTIKSSNSSLPAIRNKRTLNFLLYAVARAMGYTLTPTNPDAEWIPRQQPSPAQPSAQPCTTPPPPCRPNPPSTPPPCVMPPTSPPCGGSGQFVTIPPNQIDANTISYPYRPARTIPLFNFAPLPAGVRVPYPPLLQPPAQQRSPCPPPQPSPPPCGNTPAPSPPPCMTTPAPRTSPCSPPTPPPCGPTPTPSPPPCGTTPAPSPPPCKPTPTPPCGTTPAPSPPPCKPTPTPPCGTTPAPSPPPCATTPMPPPCATPTPAPCANPPAPPPPPPSEPPKKGTVLLEYDDPVRIQIFSNGKKYLPASGSIYSGSDDDQKEDWHSSFAPANEEPKKKDEDYEEEKEEMEEEHFEEEEDEIPGQLKHFEEEDEGTSANEEDESETNLSIVKKPAEEDNQKINRRRLISLKTKTIVSSDSGKMNEKEDNTKAEKSPKMKTPKRKKWVRIVKKQRRKTKGDSSSPNSFKVYSSDNFAQSSQTVPKLYEKRDSHSGFDSFERDVSDYSGDSSIDDSEDVTQIDLKKVIVNKKPLSLPDYAIDSKQYEFNINPYALEPKEERRKKLEKAVERYVEDYVEKQLGDALVKNTGVPKTTVFEFAPRNGPKIQTITTTVAKTSHSGSPVNLKPQIRPETLSHYKTPIRNARVHSKNSFEENYNDQGDISYEDFGTRT